MLGHQGGLVVVASFRIVGCARYGDDEVEQPSELEPRGTVDVPAICHPHAAEALDEAVNGEESRPEAHVAAIVKHRDGEEDWVIHQVEAEVLDGHHACIEDDLRLVLGQRERRHGGWQICVEGSVCVRARAGRQAQAYSILYIAASVKSGEVRRALKPSVILYT